MQLAASRTRWLKSRQEMALPRVGRRAVASIGPRYAPGRTSCRSAWSGHDGGTGGPRLRAMGVDVVHVEHGLWVLAPPPRLRQGLDSGCALAAALADHDQGLAVDQLAVQHAAMGPSTLSCSSNPKASCSQTMAAGALVYEQRAAQARPAGRWGFHGHGKCYLGLVQPRLRILGTAFGRRRKASGVPEPSKGRR